MYWKYTALGQTGSEMIENDTLQESQRLSHHMEKSMDSGLFWLCLAARHSQMFDEIYWTFLDRIYYGEFISIDDRVEQHLDQEKREKFGQIYQIKLEQANEGTIDSCYSIEDVMEFNKLRQIL
ncbi:hypothetical protein FQN57_001659 [Myotisia sp. PD_48]|nr:hypothetical protein FQN57_001659 [Myotisia sp. PD_48]